MTEPYRPPWMRPPGPIVSEPPPAPEPTPEPASLEQEYFDKTLRHLVAQGKRAYEDGQGCRYWTPEGLRCAVGCHIPDGHEAQFASGGIPCLRTRFPELAGVAWPNTEQGSWLAAMLQQLHDSEDHWGESGFVGWAEARGILRRFSLSSAVLDELELASRPD